MYGDSYLVIEAKRLHNNYSTRSPRICSVVTLWDVHERNGTFDIFTHIQFRRYRARVGNFHTVSGRSWRAISDTVIWVIETAQWGFTVRPASWVTVMCILMRNAHAHAQRSAGVSCSTALISSRWYRERAVSSIIRTPPLPAARITQGVVTPRPLPS